MRVRRSRASDLVAPRASGAEDAALWGDDRLLRESTDEIIKRRTRGPGPENLGTYRAQLTVDDERQGNTTGHTSEAHRLRFRWSVGSLCWCGR